MNCAMVKPWMRARTLTKLQKTLTSSMHSHSSAKVAVLYQAIEPPVIDGIRKPMKPGGYRDSGADIAYILQKARQPIVTPLPDPSPEKDEDWCFPDTENGILTALNHGASHLWANTILFNSHPLQASEQLNEHSNSLHVVGQAPSLVEKYDDKFYANKLLQDDGSFEITKSQLITSLSDVDLNLTLPIIAKPVRGRGSYGVKLCTSQQDLVSHLERLLKESSSVMLEEYLAGQEGTVSVMPPTSDNSNYTALPIVVRFNHHEGIAPYNGIVAVTANSRTLSTEERNSSAIYNTIEQQCVRIAEHLKVTAPIRIDVRQRSDDKDSPFVAFDINMKPNMTGPGRPGREDQASLTALAAQAIGWTYPRLLQEILTTAQPLSKLRSTKPS